MCLAALTCNISYHRISNDKGFRKTWLARIRRDNLPPLQNCYVCSEYFTVDCLETDTVNALLKVKRRLKREAITSVFSFGSEPKNPRISSENRKSQERAQELQQEVGVEYRTQTYIFLKINKIS